LNLYCDTIEKPDFQGKVGKKRSKKREKVASKAWTSTGNWGGHLGSVLKWRNASNKKIKSNWGGRGEGGRDCANYLHNAPSVELLLVGGNKRGESV